MSYQIFQPFSSYGFLIEEEWVRRAGADVRGFRGFSSGKHFLSVHTVPGRAGQ